MVEGREGLGKQGGREVGREGGENGCTGAGQKGMELSC